MLDFGIVRLTKKMVYISYNHDFCSKIGSYSLRENVVLGYYLNVLAGNTYCCTATDPNIDLWNITRVSVNGSVYLNSEVI